MNPNFSNHSLRSLPLLSVALLVMLSNTSHAQLAGHGRYYPPHQTSPVGSVGELSTRSKPDTQGYCQPVRIDVPSTAQVTYFSRRLAHPVTVANPAPAALMVGQTYRLRISHMPEFPGLEIYPTVEILDRLHPPAGREAEFPVPLVFTEDEIRFALAGRLVSKVIYLEQPDRANTTPRDDTSPILTRTAAPGENLIALADGFGRPMALIRMGGRLPDATDHDPEFYGSGGPIYFPVPGTIAAGPDLTRRSHLSRHITQLRR